MNGSTATARKILILTAIPDGLHLDKEIREIEEAIRRSVRREQFETRIRTAVRPQDIRRALAEEQPHIVHFCGHGTSDGCLILEDDSGNHKLISPQGLAALFKLHREPSEESELLLSGLVVRQENALKIYNLIYESIFNQTWIERTLANLRPYSEAITTWLASNCSDRSQLLRGQALQNAHEWAEGKQLSNEDYRFLNASSQLDRSILVAQLSVASQEAQKQKKEFLANISHELRTPLNGIIGYLKLILEGMADDVEEERQFLLEAHQSSLYLLDLINDLLGISKLEAGKIELDLCSIKLNELFSDVENSQRPQAEARGLTFHIQTPEIIVYSDYLRLKQVMFNLIGNAIKFTHQGGIAVTIDIVWEKVTFQDRQFPGRARVHISDTGIGVSSDKQDKLFQLFSQINDSQTHRSSGTGLGLAISQKLVEAMGGEIDFYSAGEGLGSTVTFSILLNDMTHVR